MHYGVYIVADKVFIDGNDRPLKLNDCVLMQFTGLFDSSGKVKVWENDIVYYCYDPIVDNSDDDVWHYYDIVTFCNGAFGTGALMTEFDPFASLNSLIEGSSSINQQVIGNIFQNPELRQYLPKPDETLSNCLVTV